MTEKQVEQYLVTQAEKLGAEVRKLKFIGRRGAPDRIIMFKGETFFVELKAHGSKLQPHQEREIAKLKAVGQWVYVLDSVWEIDAFIRDMKAWPLK